jgi:hypothetical protein
MATNPADRRGVWRVACGVWRVACGVDGAGEEAVDEVSRRLVQTSYECLFKAIEGVKPGALYRSLGGLVSRLDASRPRAACLPAGLPACLPLIS